MSTKYFQPSINNPKIVKSVVQRLLIYLVNVYYQQELIDEQGDYDRVMRKRILLADIGAGEGIVLKDAAKSFQTVNPDFPFTAYNTADSVEGEVRSFGSYSGQHFSPVFNKFIKSWPMKLEMPMISFFARADDYWRMKTVVHDDNINLSRMWIPMKWGEIDVAFPIDIGFQVSKGEYAAEFQRYLEINRIWDLVHIANIAYYDFLLEDQLTSSAKSDADSTGKKYKELSGNPNNTLEVLTVTEMVIRLNQMAQDSNLVTKSTNIQIPGVEISTLDAPTVVATTPANKSVGVLTSIPTITLKFNKYMMEQIVLNRISIWPYIDQYPTWNDDSTELTLNLKGPLSPKTVFTITIPRSVEDGDGITLENDFIFTFTTGSV